MNNAANTIEDLLEILTGLQGQDKMQIESNDATIMYSIARQTFKGTALTDRQHILMKEKLQSYRNQFTALEYDFDRAIDGLRCPLRFIDRSKYIKIIQDENNKKWIKVRFPFSKKLIMSVNEVSNKVPGEYHRHDKGSHEHFFLLDDRSIKLVMEQFSGKDFEIDDDIIKQYEKIKDVTLLDFFPTYYKNELLNTSSELTKLIQKDTDNNKFKIADRRFRYGLSIPDLSDYEHVGLESKIIKRSSTTYHSNPKEESFKQIMDALTNLDRFPIVVLLEDRNAENQLYEFWDYFRYRIPTEEQSVMFRLDNEHNQDFNLFVKDKGLNNMVDKNTKVVYINKINKVVMRTDWTPITAFSYTSSLDRTLDAYISDMCDLIVFREEELSPFRRYSRYYG